MNELGKVRAGTLTLKELNEITDVDYLDLWFLCWNVYCKFNELYDRNWLGMGLPGCGTIPAVYAEKNPGLQNTTGMKIMELVKKNIKGPHNLMTKAAFENAITVDMSFGGSSNTTLHFLAIVMKQKLKLTLDDFEKISRNTHYLCSFKSYFFYFLEDLYFLGGIRTCDECVEQKDKINLDVLTVTGKKVRDNIKVYL